MAVFSIVGKLGTGKTKFAVWRAWLALLDGRRVASNVDLVLPSLLGSKPGSYVRVPDKPTEFDLEAIGHGNPDSYDEDRNGVLILDELGTWLNSRSFQDKSRAGVIDWLIHARKHGWDVYLIVQDANMIDRQVRESLIEYECRCTRLDRIKIPFVSIFFALLADVVTGIGGAGLANRWKVKRWGFLPRGHLVVSRLGVGANAVVAERWMYRGDHLHQAYDTRQVFSANYAHGSFSVLHRPPPPAPTWFERLAARFAPAPRPVLKPKLPEVAALSGLARDEAWRQAARLARLAPHWKAGN